MTELFPKQEITWHRVWLRSVLTDADRSGLASIRPVRLPPKMTLTRRLEKLHRLRTALEPPRSWLRTE